MDKAEKQVQADLAKIVQTQVDCIADVIWWVKGYIAGARDNLEECPFVHTHIKALQRAHEALADKVEALEGGE